MLTRLEKMCLSQQGYQTFVKEMGSEPMLPGLEYTPNQLFWISSANVRVSDCVIELPSN